MKSIYLNWIKIISEIKKSSHYLLMVMIVFQFFNFCLRGVHSLFKYLVNKLNVPIPQKIIKYPQPEEEEDIIGI